jgi:serpin B
MLILLPSNDSNLSSLEESLTLEKLSEWRQQLSQKTIPVQIPKFTLDTDYDLIEILTGMGISSLFDEISANFGAMTDDYDGLYVSIAIHKAFVDVNEEGTEAAAATGIGGFMGGYPTFLADRPFLFIIQDNETGQILFMGRIMDPTK